MIRGIQVRDILKKEFWNGILQTSFIKSCLIVKIKGGDK